jgi:hypothetical protein
MQPIRYFYKTSYYEREWKEAGWILKIESPMISILNVREDVWETYIILGEYSNGHYILRNTKSGETSTLTANKDRAILYNDKEAVVFK